MTLDGSISCVNSLFQQPWWLNAVAPGQWEAIVLRRGEDIAARLPYVVKKRYGFTLLTMPKLTQTLGPWLRPTTGKYVNQLSLQKELMTELIERLPPHDLFLQNFHLSVENWLPFYWYTNTFTAFYYWGKVYEKILQKAASEGARMMRCIDICKELEKVGN